MKLTALIPSTAAALLMFAACTGGDGGDGSRQASEESAWAASVCAIAQDMSESLASVEEVEDPTTLPLEERKERAARLQEPVAGALEAAAAQMEEISPPSGASDYHEALANAWAEVARVSREAGETTAAATSTEEIEAANASVNIVFERVGEDALAAWESLTDAAQAALRGVNNCGDIVLP